MSTEQGRVTDTPDDESASADSDGRQRLIQAVTVTALVGVVAAIVGIGAGVHAATRRVTITCPNGTYFPQGTTDFRCFSHPELDLGIATIGACVALAALLVVATVAAHVALGRATGPQS